MEIFTLVIGIVILALIVFSFFQSRQKVAFVYIGCLLLHIGWFVFILFGLGNLPYETLQTINHNSGIFKVLAVFLMILFAVLSDVFRKKNRESVKGTVFTWLFVFSIVVLINTVILSIAALAEMDMLR